MSAASYPAGRLAVPALLLAAALASCHTFPTDPEATRWESPPSRPPLANVSGRVLLSGTATPVAGALVWINDVSSVSDANGNYNIASVRGPQVLVQAAKDGFDTTRVGLQLNTTNVTFNVQMRLQQ